MMWRTLDGKWVDPNYTMPTSGHTKVTYEVASPKRQYEQLTLWDEVAPWRSRSNKVGDGDAALRLDFSDTDPEAAIRLLARAYALHERTGEPLMDLLGRIVSESLEGFESLVGVYTRDV